MISPHKFNDNSSGESAAMTEFGREPMLRAKDGDDNCEGYEKTRALSVSNAG
jgi:hypothetical protein